MTLRVNGEVMEVPDDLTIAGLLEHLGYAGAVVAVAVGGVFVGRSHHEATPLHEGCEVEIVAPMQGG